MADEGSGFKEEGQNASSHAHVLTQEDDRQHD
jgi:hypothetical protein